MAWMRATSSSRWNGSDIIVGAETEARGPSDRLGDAGRISTGVPTLAVPRLQHVIAVHVGQIESGR